MDWREWWEKQIKQIIVSLVHSCSICLWLDGSVWGWGGFQQWDIAHVAPPAVVWGGVRGRAAVGGGARAEAVIGLTYQGVFTRAFVLMLLQEVRRLLWQELQLRLALARQTGLVLQRHEDLRVPFHKKMYPSSLTLLWDKVPFHTHKKKF